MTEVRLKYGQHLLPNIGEQLTQGLDDKQTEYSYRESAKTYEQFTEEVEIQRGHLKYRNILSHYCGASAECYMISRAFLLNCESTRKQHKTGSKGEYQTGSSADHQPEWHASQCMPIQNSMDLVCQCEFIIS